MTTFNCERKKPLEDLVKNIVGAHWGDWVTDLVTVDEVMDAVGNINVGIPVKDVISVVFANNDMKPGDSVGWTLKDINSWFDRVHLDSDKKGWTGWSIKVPNPYPYEAYPKPLPKLEKVKSCTDETVNHPKHYNTGRFEVIDIIEDFSKGLGGRIAFDNGNAIKYILRWHNKNGVEDLKKAIWYIQDLIKHLESEEKNNDNSANS